MKKDNFKQLQQQYDELMELYKNLNLKFGLAMQQECRMDKEIKELKESLKQEKLKYVELLERYIHMMEEVIK